MSFPLRCFYKYMSLSFLHKFHMIYGNASKMDFLKMWIYPCQKSHSFNLSINVSENQLGVNLRRQNSEILHCCVYSEKISSFHVKDVIEDKPPTKVPKEATYLPNEGSPAAGHKTTKCQLSCLSLNHKCLSPSPRTRANPAISFSLHLHPPERKHV